MDIILYYINENKFTITLKKDILDNLYEGTAKIWFDKKEIDNLNKMSDKLVTGETVPQSAEMQSIKEKAEEKIVEKKEEVEIQLTDIKKDEQVVQQNPAMVLNNSVTP